MCNLHVGAHPAAPAAPAFKVTRGTQCEKVFRNKQPDYVKYSLLLLFVMNFMFLSARIIFYASIFKFYLKT